MTDLTNTEAPTGPLDDDGVVVPKHAAWALVLICVAQLMVVLDSSIANIALPKIQASLDIAPANLSWIVTGYALAFGGLLLLGGRLGDIFGRRRIFILGVALFAVASAVGGVAQNEAMLLGSRGLQGLGAAMASPTALALITTTFPAGPARNRAFSVFAAMAGLGAAIGLILGGWLTGLDPGYGWRLTFLINVPIGLAAAFFAPVVLPEGKSLKTTLDIPGAILGTFGLLALVFGITRTSNNDSSLVDALHPQGIPYGWGDPVALTSIILGVLALVTFVVVESRIKNPIMPLSIFASRYRATAFVAMMLTPAAMFAMFYFLSLFIQNVMGYGSLKAGFAFLPFTFGMVGGATIASKLMSRLDPRYLAGTGTLVAGFCLFMFSRLDSSGVNYWTDIAPFIFIMSVGMGLIFVPMTLVAVHGVPMADAGIGSGVLNTMQQVGGALGLATLGAVSAHFSQSKFDRASFTSGATHAFLTGAIMMLAASALIWVFLNVKHTEISTDDLPEGVGV